MKKFISIVLSASLIIISLISVSAMDSNSENLKKQHETKAIESHIKVVDFYTKNCPENFAGTFVDELGDLNINIAEKQRDSEKNLKDYLKDSNIKFHNVKYSVSELDNAISCLNEIMISHDINMIERDDKSNKVYVYIKNINNSKIINIKKSIERPFIVFKESTDNISLTISDVINGDAFSTPSGAATLGIGAKKSDGTIGYIIPGHTPDAVGTSVKYGTDTIGTISQKVFGGSTDAAFVKKTGTSWQPSKKLNGTTNINYMPTADIYTQVNTMSSYAQGMSIYKWGKQTFKTSGTILSNNFSYTVDGVAFTNMVKSSYMAIGGDSGAPVGYQNSSISNQNQYTIIGLHSASSLDANGNWGSGSFSIFSKILYDLNSLDVTPYPQ